MSTSNALTTFTGLSTIAAEHGLIGDHGIGERLHGAIRIAGQYQDIAPGLDQVSDLDAVRPMQPGLDSNHRPEVLQSTARIPLPNE